MMSIIIIIVVVVAITSSVSMHNVNLRSCTIDLWCINVFIGWIIVINVMTITFTITIVYHITINTTKVQALAINIVWCNIYP